MNPPSDLLDEALGLGHGGAIAPLPVGRVVLVEDCIETSGAFVLHHLLKRALSAGEGGGAVLFLALAQPFSHYDRVLRKLGCNLSVQRNSNKLHFFDMLKLEFPSEYEAKQNCFQPSITWSFLSGPLSVLLISSLYGHHGLTGGNDIEGGFVELYCKIQRAIEASRSKEYSRGCITIMIDDLSLLEIAACGSIDCVLDFLYYCVSLTSELDCSLVILNHEDIYSSEEAPRLLLHLEYLADIVIKTEPLSTGLAADVHGQGKPQVIMLKKFITPLFSVELHFRMPFETEEFHMYPVKSFCCVGICYHQHRDMEPRPGDSADHRIINGQKRGPSLTIFNKGTCNRHGHSTNKIHNFHFKVKENGVEYFYPGSQY